MSGSIQEKLLEYHDGLEYSGKQLIKTVYCDGGVINKNPSPIGGTWAFCCVDEYGNRIVEAGGLVLSTPKLKVTNNHTEQIAICRALEYLPIGWTGTLHSDSKIALGRVFDGWRCHNLPGSIQQRTRDALRRMGKIKYVLLQGHPTKQDLENGFGAKRGRPVSIHNCWCDDECNNQKKFYFAKLKEKEEQNG